MIGEVAAVLSALKALNDGLSTIKEAAGHGHTLQSLVGRWATANEKYRDVERNKEESRIAQEKEVARLKKRRKEVRKNLKLAGTVFFGWLSFMCLVFLFVWAWEYNSGL